MNSLQLFVFLLIFSAIPIYFHKELFVTCNRFKITNLVCTSTDEKLLHFRHCYIKAVRRGVVAAFVHMENYGRDILNLTMNFAIMKKATIYRPFLYNITVDGCKMVKYFRSNPVLKIIYDAGCLSENIIHDCPYNHDIIFHNYLIKEKFLEILPVPAGDYALVISLKVYNVLKVVVSGYATLSDSKKVESN